MPINLGLKVQCGSLNAEEIQCGKIVTGLLETSEIGSVEHPVNTIHRASTDVYQNDLKFVESNSGDTRMVIRTDGHLAVSQDVDFYDGSDIETGVKRYSIGLNDAGDKFVIKDEVHANELFTLDSSGLDQSSINGLASALSQKQEALTLPNGTAISPTVLDTFQLVSGGDGVNYSTSLLTAGAIENWFETLQNSLLMITPGQTGPGYRAASISTSSPSAVNVPSSLAVSNFVSTKLQDYALLNGDNSTNFVADELTSSLLTTERLFPSNGSHITVIGGMNVSGALTAYAASFPGSVSVASIPNITGPGGTLGAYVNTTINAAIASKANLAGSNTQDFDVFHLRIHGGSAFTGQLNANGGISTTSVHNADFGGFRRIVTEEVGIGAAGSNWYQTPVVKCKLKTVSSTDSTLQIRNEAETGFEDLHAKDFYFDGTGDALSVQLSAKAPKASPTFTGTVTVPNVADIAGTSGSATLAAYVAAQIPSLTGYALKASPTFSGTVTVPNVADIAGTSGSATLAAYVAAQIPSLTGYAQLSGANFTGGVTAPSLTVTSDITTTELTAQAGSITSPNHLSITTATGFDNIVLKPNNTTVLTATSSQVSVAGNVVVSGSLTATLSGDVLGVSSTVNSVTGHRVQIGSSSGNDNSVTIGMPSHIVIPAGQALAGSNISNVFTGIGRTDLFHSFLPITFQDDGTFHMSARASKSITFYHEGPTSTFEANKRVDGKAGEIGTDGKWKFYTQIQKYGGMTNASDDRLKINERPIADALQTIRQLAPQRYTRIVREGETSGFEEAGLIAQDVDAIPELQYTVTRPESETSTDPITGETRTNYFALDYDSIMVHALKALQELDAIVQTQATTIATLQSRLDAL